jgi:hypothetical protein
MSFLGLLAAGVSARADRPQDKSLPTPHRQFFTRLETTAHQLNATSDYPPYKRYLSVHYDYTARRARIDYEPVPHMPPKSYVRRYDHGIEWMVTEIRSTKECQKSRLREAMPMPAFPERFIYMGQARVRGKLCDHWREDHGEETVEYFESADTGIPMRLTTEAVESVSPTRVTTPLMTYDFYRFEPGPQPEDVFRMRASSQSAVFGTDNTLTIAECDRVVQDMGFPYVRGLPAPAPAPVTCPPTCFGPVLASSALSRLFWTGQIHFFHTYFYA